MIKIISRKSDLAVIQAEIVANALKQADKDISVSFIKKETEGDIDQLTSLSKLSNIGVFTNDIRDSLLNNEADLAVHSLKDLPIEDQKDTLIVSMLERADSRDILFLKKDIFENYNNKDEEKPNFEVESIEIANPQLFSNNEEGETLNQENTVKETTGPGVFENSDIQDNLEKN